MRALETPASVLPPSPLESAISSFLLDRRAKEVTLSRMTTLNRVVHEWQAFCSGHQTDKLSDLPPALIRTYVLSLHEQYANRKSTTLNIRGASAG